MNTRLHQLYARLEEKKAALISAVETLSPEDFNKRPSPDVWSISEVLAHLQTSEQLSVQYMNKKILGIDQLKQTHVGHELLMMVVKVSQRLPFKFRAPAVVVKSTPSYASVQQLQQQWKNTREAMRQLLEKFEEHHLTRAVYRHPVAGLINVQHAVIFFHEHLLHHQPQVMRALKKLGN